MDLELATIDDIAAELTKRTQPFLMILSEQDRGRKKQREEIQLHCHGMDPNFCLVLLKESCGIFEMIINGGDIPENVKIVERMIKDGEVYKERTIELREGEVFDPWDTSWEEKKRDKDKGESS
jgi:hypothetical protein